MFVVVGDVFSLWGCKDSVCLLCWVMSLVFEAVRTACVCCGG